MTTVKQQQANDSVLQAQKSDNIDARNKKVPKLPILEGLNWLIHLNYVKKDYKTCKELIRDQLTATNGLCEYALYVQALIMRQEGRIQESLDLFQSCAVLNPTNAQNLKQVARSLFLLGRHKAAVDVYGEASKLAPTDWEITHNLGVCFVHLKNSEKAKIYFKEAINISKHELSFHMLAKLFIKEGNNAAAIEVLIKAVEFNAESCELLTVLGLLYMKEKEYQKAFEALGNALTYNPTHYKSILAICNMIQVHHDYDVALNKYRIAADSAPESARLWNNIGMCFFGKKKYVAAISCLKRSTYLSPFEWKTLYNLGLIHLTMQQYASGFQYLSAAINLKPKESMVYSLLAVALTHLNDTKNAQHAYEHALAMDGDNVYTNLNYAVFLYNQGDRRMASTRLLTFRKNYDALVQAKRRDLDPELQSIAAKLGPILHLGESVVNPPAAVATAPPLPSETADLSAKKYQDFTNSQNELYRETTMASVSNVAMSGYESRLNSAASVKTTNSEFTSATASKDKDFDADF